MADREIPDLPDGGAAANGDLVHVVRGANSRKATLHGSVAAQITAGTDEAFADTAELTARKADGSLLKRSWLNIKAAISAALLIDEDDMASDSATKAPTQQSVVAYLAEPLAAPRVRASVNFDGSRNADDSGASSNGNPVLIRGSHNVSSVIKNGTGDYTINFTEDLQDANYVLSGAARRNDANNAAGTSLAISGITAPTASAVRVYTVTWNNSAFLSGDSSQVHVAIFR